jgi:TLD
MSVPTHNGTYRDGKFGLWIDAELDKGFSERCPAFGNEVLCREGGERSDQGSNFNVLGVEVWGVGLL